jgi:4-hydroxy-3-methylbut-2-enyl diphosphate reductase
VNKVIERIQQLTGASVAQLVGVEEGVSFPLPKELAI